MRDFASTSLFKSDLLLRCHDLPWQLATSTHSPATRIEEHRHTHYKETLFPSIAHALEANPTLFSFLFVKQPEELSTKAQYIYINTACYKAKPELYLWSMQALELKVSARGHAHWQPQQLGYNWLPAALFSPTIIKVRSPFFFFLPHGVSLYTRGTENNKVRIVRLLVTWKKKLLFRLFAVLSHHWTSHTFLKAKKRATSVTTSWLRYTFWLFLPCLYSFTRTGITSLDSI